MTPEQAAALRAPFPPETIGKLPRAGIQLDYVGHAAVTDRLLAVDPEWTWEPFAVTDLGTPRITTRGNDAVLWIRLTLAGVTRPGVGSVKADAFDCEKQLISDALRNAAMRFGVALDLWSKEDLQAGGDVDAATDRDMPPSGEAGPSGAAGTRRADRQQSPADAPPAASTVSQGRATPRETTRTDPAQGAAAAPPIPAAVAAAPEPVNEPAHPDVVRLATQLVESVGIVDWVKEQDFPWPWPQTVVDVINAKAQAVIKAHPGPRPLAEIVAERQAANV